MQECIDAIEHNIVEYERLEKLEDDCKYRRLYDNEKEIKDKMRKIRKQNTRLVMAIKGFNDEIQGMIEAARVPADRSDIKIDGDTQISNLEKCNEFIRQAIAEN